MGRPGDRFRPRRACRGIPYLGVCFGAQVLAAALGGRSSVRPGPSSDGAEVRRPRRIVAPGPWFQWHGDRLRCHRPGRPCLRRTTWECRRSGRPEPRRAVPSRGRPSPLASWLEGGSTEKKRPIRCSRRSGADPQTSWPTTRPMPRRRQPTRPIGRLVPRPDGRDQRCLMTRGRPARFPCASARTGSSPTTRSRCGRRMTIGSSATVPRADHADIERRGRRAAGASPRGRAPGPRAGRDPRRARRAAPRARRAVRARSSPTKSAKPIKTARVEAARAVDTFAFSAAVARTLTGEVVPLDASGAGVGKLGFVLRVPIGVVGAISPFNFPLNLVCHKVAPGDRRRLPGGAQAGVGHAAHRAAARRAAARRVRAARRAGSTSSPAAGSVGQPPRRAPRRRHDHVHRLARRRLGHPRARRPARRSASSSATTPRSSSSPTATASRRDQDRGRRLLASPASRASRSSASTCTRRSRDEFVDALVAEVEAAGRRRPARRRHRRVAR